ncbi:MAG: Ig-like domain-containing protein [Pyrinomonadaceae bacterium]
MNLKIRILATFALVALTTGLFSSSSSVLAVSDCQKAKGNLSAVINANGSTGTITRGPVHALFDLDRPETGPFPTDRFTVADRSHNTGRRVNLPYPDCAVRGSDCEDLDVINTLDGFGLQTRISIPFDGQIDPATVTDETVFVISLSSTLPGGEPGGQVIGINQIVWDPVALTLHVEVNDLLDQHWRYALLVTSGMRDPSGAPVEASKAFRRFRHDLNFGQTRDPELKAYRKALLGGLEAARALGVQERDVVTASVFTTQSITSVMERIRDQIKAGTPESANFLLGPTGERAVFNRADVRSIAWRQQTRQNPTGFTPANLDLGVLQVVPGAVATIAHGVYTSPDYQVHPGEYIPAVGTLTGTPEVRGYNQIYFSLFLPAGPKPAAGWPVAIVGHGGGSSRHLNSTGALASKLASYGIATIGITAPGFGFGSQGTLTINLTGGSSLTIPDGGRGFDQDGNGVIGNDEGSVAAAPRAWTVGGSDGNKQTVVDLMQLVRVIEVGMDVDGDGSSDLDPGRIYYLGLSAGAMYGTIFMALEPSVSAAVGNVPGGLLPEHGRWAPGRRSGLGVSLQARTPSLINSPGITQIDGVPINGPHFNENKPLRNRPAVTNMIAGAIDIQAAFEMLEWGQQSGQSPVVWVRHLRESPLPGLYPKSVIYQFGKADQNANNPGTTAILRAGNLADRTLHYRHDLAFAEDPTIPKNPHSVVVLPTHPNALFRSIARGLQDQIGIFYASGGAVVIRPEPSRFFEVPVEGPLPEDLNYIP